MLDQSLATRKPENLDLRAIIKTVAGFLVVLVFGASVASGGGGMWSTFSSPKDSAPASLVPAWAK